MVRLKLVVLVLVAVVNCRALEKRFESKGLEWNRLAKKADSRPVDMEALFWSYFYRGSVERAGLFTEGYTRESPDQWEGRASMRSPLANDKVMLLGEMARVSEGPRRRKREVKRSEGGKEVRQPGQEGDEQDRGKVHNWQRRGIFHPNLLPRKQHWRSCTRLCDRFRPPPGFPPCCPTAPLGQQFETTRGRSWLDATEQFLHSYPLAVFAFQTVFSIAVINVLVSQLGGSGLEDDVSGRSWDATEEEEEEGERLLIQVRKACLLVSSSDCFHKSLPCQFSKSRLALGSLVGQLSPLTMSEIPYKTL